MMARFAIFAFLIGWIGKVFPQDTSAASVKIPKHYFKNIILLDYYQMPLVTLTQNDEISKKIESYQAKQSVLAFNIPMMTREWQREDSAKATLHLLLSGLSMKYNPGFSGIPTRHELTKNGLGVRVIFGNGKKSVFFAEWAPSVTKDRGYTFTRVPRLASTLLWSYTSGEWFNLRLGVTKSFLWGNRYYLPFVGFRIGKMQKFYVSIQFPRQIYITSPIGSRLRWSLFTRPQGGFFTMANKDSLYTINFDKNKTLYLGRVEFLGGARLDVYPTSWLNVYISSGYSLRNYLALYSYTYNQGTKFGLGPFFESKPPRNFFFNFGLVFQFGKTRSYYQRKDIHDQIQMNNENGPMDQNNMIFDKPQRNKTSLNSEELSDLINTFDY